ncbi:MAG: HD domain-containing protein, partial [Gammaproteobacteria bacterium]|nr:HD domain-containing protein [Gammaproteobacteria bacterium]
VIEPGLKNLKHQIEITRPKKQNRKPIPATPLPELEATSIEEELKTAQPLRRLAMESINNAFYDVKMGRSVDSSEIKQSVKQLTDSVLRNQDALLALGQIRHKNTYIYDHAINTCVLALTFGKWKKFDYETVITLGTAALLHDIGETKLDDRLIRNKGYLNDHEFNEIQQHVEHSVQLLTTSIGINALTVKLVQQHHERLDGSGYPSGLTGDEIDPLAQILGLVDVYDSMTAETVYSYAIAPTHVLKQLLESNDDLFENQLIKQFIKCIGIYPVGSLVRLSNGCIAIVNEITDQDSLHPKVKMIYNARQEHFIQPIDLNLADPVEHENDLSITGCVDPNHLHIDLAAFI